MITNTLRKGRVALLPAIWLPLVLSMAACEEKDALDIIGPGPGPGPTPIISAVAVFADSSADFGALHTFALVDTVLHVNPATGTPIPVSRAFDQDIINSVRDNFLARGYVEALNPETVTPDFIVTISATTTQNQNAWINYPWYRTWSFYPGLAFYNGFNNNWIIVYPWAPYVPATVHPRGTFIVDLIPTGPTINPLSSPPSVSAAWSGVATGLLTGTRTGADFDAAVDQMFLLSPYLRADSLIVNPL